MTDIHEQAPKPRNIVLIHHVDGTKDAAHPISPNDIQEGNEYYADEEEGVLFAPVTGKVNETDWDSAEETTLGEN